MIDLRRTIAPKSDQLNADDLIGSSIVITITGVKLCSEADQPVAIHFEGDNGKAYRPCKSMRRALVAVWGPDAKTYTGKKLKLFRDEKVLFGGVPVGGIRISHMSGIDKPVTMALTVTRASRKPFTVHPLGNEPEALSAANIEVLANSSALKGTGVLRAFWDSLDAAQKKALQPSIQNLKKLAAENDFASDTNARSSLGGGERAEAHPEPSLDVNAHHGSPGGAQASGEAAPSPDEPPFDQEDGASDPKDPLEAAYVRGRADRRSGKSVRALPGEYRTQERSAEADEWRAGWKDQDQEGSAT